jgi:ABC-type nitrate/sulfonate/bicarbonate transport system substrate-binding protein
MTNGQVNAQPSKMLRIASKAAGESSLPYLIAQRLGFLREEGLDVEVIVIRGTVGIQALIGGSVDYVNHNVIPAILREPNIKILVVEADKPAHYLVTTSSITSFKQLVGKTIAIDDYAANVGLLTREMLAKNGVPVTAVNLRVFGDPGIRMQGLLGGSVDACLLNLPLARKAEAQGFRVLAYSGDFSSALAFSLVTTDKRIQASPGEVYKMVKATLKGLIFMYGNPEETLKFYMEDLRLSDINSARDLLQDRLKRSSEIARTGIASEENLIANVERVKEQIQFRGAKLQTKRELGLKDVYDLSFVKKAYEELRAEQWNPQKYRYLKKR